jgi:hypothetical protein
MDKLVQSKLSDDVNLSCPLFTIITAETLTERDIQNPRGFAPSLAICLAQA